MTTAKPKPLWERPRVIPAALRAVAGVTGVMVRELIKRNTLDIPSCRRIAWARAMVAGLLHEIGAPGKVIARTLQMTGGGRIVMRHKAYHRTEKVYASRYEAARRMFVELTKPKPEEPTPP